MVTGGYREDRVRRDKVDFTTTQTFFSILVKKETCNE